MVRINGKGARDFYAFLPLLEGFIRFRVPFLTCNNKTRLVHFDVRCLIRLRICVCLYILWRGFGQGFRSSQVQESSSALAYGRRGEFIEYCPMQTQPLANQLQLIRIHISSPLLGLSVNLNHACLLACERRWMDACSVTYALVERGVKGLLLGHFEATYISLPPR